MIDRNLQPLGHAAIAVDADHLHRLTAVGLAASAGTTLATVQVGDHVHRLVLEAGTGRLVYVVGQSLHRAGQFMPQHPRVVEVGLVAAEGVDIGAADPDARNAHQGLAAGKLGAGALFQGHLPWFDADRHGHWLVGLAHASESATTFWVCTPRPSMPRRMVWPGRRNTGGFWPRPTPGGVPVEMTSPGCRLMKRLR